MTSVFVSVWFGVLVFLLFFFIYIKPRIAATIRPMTRRASFHGKTQKATVATRGRLLLLPYIAVNEAS